MNEIAKRFLLAGDEFMPEIHLRSLVFTHSVGGLFTKKKERIQKFKETRDTRNIYQKELNKSCFQHDMAYEDFIDLTRRTVSDKIVYGKEFDIAKNPKYDWYQCGLASMI